MRKIYLFLLMFLVFSCLASAGMVFEQHKDVQLKVPCTNAGHYCSDSALCNITVLYPDGKAFVINQRMTNFVSFHNYNISANDSHEIGEHRYIAMCTDNGQNGTYPGTFEVRDDTTIDLDTNTTIVVFLLVFGIACFFLIFAQISNNEFFGFMSGIIFALLGIYLTIKGLPGVTNELLEQGFSVVLLAVGTFIIIISGYSWMSEHEEN